MESKSVILFIFEGVTEKIALENILEKIFSSNHVDVEFIGTDITSDKDITLSNIENELKNFIRDKIKPKMAKDKSIFNIYSYLQNILLSQAK